MFAIYTPNGRTFAGPLETLRRIDKPQATNSTRKHQDIDDTLSFGKSDYAVTPKAIDAYREAIKHPNKKEPIFHAYQLMSTPVQALSSSSLLKTAIAQFKLHPFKEFPIINHNLQLVGSLSREQVYTHMVKSERDYDDNNQSQTIATLFLNDDSKVYAAEPVTDIRRIAGLLVERKIHTIPIIENTGQIVGIISKADIIKAVMADPPLSLWC